MAKKKSNKAKMATKAAKATRSKPVLAPINSLPTEVLAYIFLDIGESRGYPKYPDSLLLICSRWHQVALVSPTLWSHIDIILTLPSSQRPLRRAKAFLERAGRSSLDIHIIDRPTRPRRSYDESDDECSNHEEYPPGDSNSDCSDAEVSAQEDPEALDVILSIPTRAPVRSIELLVSSGGVCVSFSPVLRKFVANCASGTLQSFASLGYPFIHFIEPIAPRPPCLPGVNSVHQPIDNMEATWLSITTLHMSGGMCPSWSGNAFRGLTDLRLSGTISMPESQLTNILKSSPRLRILKLHLQVTKALPLTTPVEPVYLDQLEALDVVGRRLDGEEFGKLTRWMVLAQKPLRLSLWCPLGAESVKSFFRRSSVTELHVRISGGIEDLDAFEEIIGLSAGLRMLAVDVCDHQFLSRNVSYRSKYTPYSSTRIDAFHLQYCHSMEMDKLRRMIKKYSIHTLTMWSSSLQEGNCVPPNREILALCPVVKRLKRREYTPMENWIKSIV